MNHYQLSPLVINLRKRGKAFQLFSMIFSALLFSGCSYREASYPCAGRIVFSAPGIEGKADIYSMNPDGSNMTNLTDNPNFDGYPTWSPDGQKIAFISNKKGGSRLFLMDADGANKTEILGTGSSINYLAWSPNGQNIATIEAVPDFASATYRIRIFQLDHSSNSQTIEVQQLYSIIPISLQWSSNGDHLAFIGLSPSPEITEPKWSSHIYLMDIESESIEKLPVGSGAISGFDWLPNERIVFSVHSESSDDIYITSIDGLVETKVNIDVDGIKEGLTRSPRGDKITFWANSNHLYTANIDGSNLKKILEIEDIVGDETQSKTVLDWQAVPCSINQ